MPSFLYAIAVPPPATVDGLDEDGARMLTPRLPVSIGLAPGNEIAIRNVPIGGRHNCLLEDTGGRWRLRRAGHSLPISVNGYPMVHETELSSGDVFLMESTSAGAHPPVFAFLEAAAGSLRRDVLPTVEEAVRAFLPLRAEERIAAIRRWFHAEIKAENRPVERIPLCRLCGRFRHRDQLVEVSGFDRGQGREIQVLALPVFATIPSDVAPFWLCLDCRSDPAATFSRGENAPMVLVEALRALEAAGESANRQQLPLERRYASAVPTRRVGVCWFCHTSREVLARGEQAICQSCLGIVRDTPPLPPWTP